MNAPNAINCSIAFETIDIEQFVVTDGQETDVNGFSVGIITFEPLINPANTVKPNIELVPTNNYEEIFDVLEAITKKHDEYTGAEIIAKFMTKDAIYTLIPSQVVKPLPIITLLETEIKIKAYDTIYRYTFPTDAEVMELLSLNNIAFTKVT